jgi:hypothetical protein
MFKYIAAINGLGLEKWSCGAVHLEFVLLFVNASGSPRQLQLTSGRLLS